MSVYSDIRWNSSPSRFLRGEGGGSVWVGVREGQRERVIHRGYSKHNKLLSVA